ncbi:MAG: flagellar assembly protein FliH [Candidatus Polarisedimenticolaceae bacterium]|nr:flagellar assembly protein FliH [Candidatus Polarisedimenticolaceae bacterium]
MSKILPGDDLDGLQPWEVPHVGDSKGSSQHHLSAPPTAAELDEIQRLAREEGFKQGKKEGYEVGHREGTQAAQKRVQSCVQQIDALLTTLNEPFKTLDDEVEQEMVTLIISMVRQLVRREVRSDPNQIIGVVREALSILPVASRNVQLKLHPDDAVLIREIYALSESDLGWRIIEDPVMSVGGCRIVTEVSQVDATLESRLANLIAPLLGSARSSDEGELGTTEGD